MDIRYENVNETAYERGTEIQRTEKRTEEFWD